MPLYSATRFGPYEIEAALGAGGMGEVYRARDVRLNRSVAIKILPSTDSARRQRFELEGRAIAALAHPHICAIYDVGHEHGVDFLVIEYIEGETLASRLQRGSLPLEEALASAIEIADALDRAHRAGVIHGDLKPSNVMLTKRGAKLLDFGLARLTGGVLDAGSRVQADSPDAAVAAASRMDPTRTQTITLDGSVAGTVQYMAPEQFAGLDADARSDLFAFGAIVHEMVTGKRAFRGDDPASVVAAILEHDPVALRTVNNAVPAALDAVTRRCLAKDPDDRWQSAGDLVWQIRRIAHEPNALAAPRHSRLREIIAWAIAAACVASLAVVIGQPDATPSGQAVIRFVMATPEGTALADTMPPMISPEGLRIAFVAHGPGDDLWVQTLETMDARALPKTDGAAFPFWSPDGTAIGFFADGKLKTISAGGGSPQAIADAPAGFGAAWSSDGTIVFSPRPGGLFRVRASGGTPTQITRIDRSLGETVHWWPHMLPDGQHFLYLSNGDRAGNNVIYLAAFDGRPRRRLIAANSSGVWSPSGHILFVRGDSLIAQPFDASRMETSGNAFPTLEKVGSNPINNLGFISVSKNGTLAYRPAMERRTRLSWVDRSGNQLSELAAEGLYGIPRVSRDGRLVMSELVDDRTGLASLWLWDILRGARTRSSFGQWHEYSSQWSPDGTSIVFVSQRGGRFDLVQRSVNSSDRDRVLLSAPDWVIPVDWSPDGKFVIYQRLDSSTGWDLWGLPMFGDGDSIPLLRTPFREVKGRISPDSRWLAYTSDETGRNEVYLQSFLSGSHKWQVSAGGGDQAVWSSNGQELFYLSSEGRLISTAILAAGRRPDSGSRKLFAVQSAGTIEIPATYLYDAVPGGQGFILNIPSAPRRPVPVTVAVDWASGVKK